MGRGSTLSIVDRDALLRDLDGLIATLDQVQRELADEITAGLKRGGDLRDACREMGEASSGSWVGWHARMYYAGYQEPSVEASWDAEWGGVYGIPDGWRERSGSEIQDEVERRAGIPLSELAHVADRIRERCEPLQREALTVLSPVCDLAGLGKEAELLAKIERIDWIVSPSNFIEAIRPTGITSRDSRAIHQGMQVPLHLNVEAAVVSNTSTIATCRDFVDDALRTARQARTKIAATKREAPLALADDPGVDQLRRRVRRQSISLFVLLALGVVAGLVAVLRLPDLGTLVQAVVIVGGALVVAGLYALFVERTHAARALAAASVGAGAIAAVDQLLAALK